MTTALVTAVGVRLGCEATGELPRDPVAQMQDKWRHVDPRKRERERVYNCGWVHHILLDLCVFAKHVEAFYWIMPPNNSYTVQTV